MTRITINRLEAASADSGHEGVPGTSASEIICTLYARRDGRWDAVGTASKGCNQGYYQENYSYGPWRGRGDTPEAAARHMLSRVDADWTDDIRKAAHDALLECEGVSFADLARAERDRIVGVIRQGERKGCRYAYIAGERHYADADERNRLRERAVRALSRICDKDESPLASLSDEELLAEIERRGLLVSP